VIEMQALAKPAWWACLVAVLALCGCQHDPYADWFVTKDVPANTLIGSYHVTEGTLRHFTAAKLPFVDGGRLPISRVTKHQEYTAVDVTLPHVGGSGSRCPEGDFGFDLELFDDSAVRSLSRDRSPTRHPLLHLTIGDPDSGDALQFERD
jgi:hypothetical protein